MTTDATDTTDLETDALPLDLDVASEPETPRAGPDPVALGDLLARVQLAAARPGRAGVVRGRAGREPAAHRGASGAAGWGVSAWKNAPDAPGLWWVRGDLASFDAPQPREIYARDGKLYVRAAAPDDGVPVPQGWQWCRVVPPDTYAEIVRERNHYRERAAEHHRRGDEARHEAATLRRRVEALESALRVVTHGWGLW